MYYTMTYGHLRPDLWTGLAGVPVMLVASNYWRTAGKLAPRTAPSQCQPVFVDCGGFYFHRTGSDYPFTYAAYIAWLEARPSGPSYLQDR